MEKDFMNYSVYPDTLFDLMEYHSSQDLPGGELYLYGVMALKNRQFSPTDATLQQLLNSGSLRYFKSDSLVKPIAQYANSLQTISRSEENSMAIFLELRKLQMQIFNHKLFSKLNNWFLQEKMDSMFAYKTKNLPLLSTDRSLLAEFANWAFLRKINNSGGRIRSYKETLEISRKLIILLKEEYHLE